MQTIDLVYIIDDDEILVMLERILIQRNKLYTASKEFLNGQDALENLMEAIAEGKELPQVILLDLNMPIMDGWQFLEEFIKLPIQNIEEKISVFIVTSSIDPADIANSRKYPVVKDYIMKPVNDQKLTEIFETVKSKSEKKK